MTKTRITIEVETDEDELVSLKIGDSEPVKLHSDQPVPRRLTRDLVEAAKAAVEIK